MQKKGCHLTDLPGSFQQLNARFSGPSREAAIFSASYKVVTPTLCAQGHKGNIPWPEKGSRFCFRTPRMAHTLFFPVV